MASFPAARPRRLRRTPALRRSVRETRIDPAALVLPLFVRQGIDAPEPVASMPGVVQHTLASVVDAVGEARAAGVRSVLLFGIPTTKDATGTSGWDPDGPVPTAIRALREAFGDEVVVWADVCQCEYTDHGHCGPLDAHGQVRNDDAVAGYVRDAVVYADAGADLVAPSGMMDGQVAALRAGLDAAGHDQVGVAAYAVKYDSALYGPFRDAAGSGMVSGDRAGHQLDAGNRREARRELALDVAEGADIVMIKPALSYLDVVADTRREVDLPVAAYHVSGEYAMIHAAAERGWIDADRAITEATTSILRAGADVVVTYAAVDLAREAHR